MRISCCFLYAISKYGYPPKLDDLVLSLHQMKEMGFEYVELEGYHEENLMEVYNNRKMLKSTCDDLGLKVINFCPVLPGSISIDKKEREKNEDLFKYAIELANYFGCRTIQMDSYTPPVEFINGDPYKTDIEFGKEYKVKIPENFSWQTQWDAIVDGITNLNNIAKSAGLPLCMEPRVGELISNTDAVLRLMDAVKDDNFGAVLDTGHLNAQKEILPLSIEKLGKQIFFLHVSDNNSLRNDHLALGQGTIDWEAVFIALKKHKFDGYVAIDIGHVPEIEKAYIDSKNYLEKLSEKIEI